MLCVSAHPPQGRLGERRVCPKSRITSEDGRKCPKMSWFGCFFDCSDAEFTAVSRGGLVTSSRFPRWFAPACMGIVEQSRHHREPFMSPRLRAVLILAVGVAAVAPGTAHPRLDA